MKYSSCEKSLGLFFKQVVKQCTAKYAGQFVCKPDKAQHFLTGGPKCGCSILFGSLSKRTIGFPNNDGHNSQGGISIQAGTSFRGSFVFQGLPAVYLELLYSVL